MGTCTWRACSNAPGGWSTSARAAGDGAWSTAGGVPAARTQRPDLGGLRGLATCHLAQLLLEFAHAVGQRADRVRHRVGEVRPVGVRALGLAAFDPYRVSWVAHDRR